MTVAAEEKKQIELYMVKINIFSLDLKTDLDIVTFNLKVNQYVVL